MQGMLAAVQAARPKTLPAAVVPVWLGCVLAFQLEGEFSWWLGTCTLLGAIFIQIATNFFNDAIDAKKGADTEKRLGPERVTASGKMSPKAVYACAFGCLAVAGVFGVFMMLERGWMMLLIGLPSFYLAYGYTGGPLPLAYRGLGELFVLVFFGWIAVMGTVFVQLGEWRWEAFLLGTQVGLLSAMLILINNIRDREEDSGTGKNTVAVLMGETWAWMLLVAICLDCYLWGIVWLWSLGAGAAYLPLLALPRGIFIVLGVRKAFESKNGKSFNKFLALSALQLILFGALWNIGVLIF